MSPQVGIRHGIPLATRQIVNAARPLVRTAAQGQIYAHAVLMLSLGQCAQDLLNEFCNLPGVQGRCRACVKSIFGQFNQQRKSLRRGIPEEEFARFESVICDITDECDRRVEWLIAVIKDELALKVPYGEVARGAMLGIIHGIVQCCNRIHERVTGRKSNEYSRILEELETMDEKLGMTLLNEHISPDPTYCVNSLMQLVEDLKNVIIERFGSKKGGDQ